MWFTQPKPAEFVRDVDIRSNSVAVAGKSAENQVMVWFESVVRPKAEREAESL